MRVWAAGENEGGPGTDGMPECPASIDGQGEEGSVPEEGVSGAPIGRMKCHVVRSMGGWNGQEEIEVSHCERNDITESRIWFSSGSQ